MFVIEMITKLATKVVNKTIKNKNNFNFLRLWTGKRNYQSVCCQ